MRYLKSRERVDVMEVLGSKWNLLVIWKLKDGAMRFTELQKSMGEVNSKTVTVHLRFLEKNNIIDRVMYAEIPPRVEYSLTEHGKAILPVLRKILTWGESLPLPKKNSLSAFFTGNGDRAKNLI